MEKGNQKLEECGMNEEGSMLKGKNDGKGDHGGDAVTISVSNGVNFIDGALMCEILSWLSVKSLVRFKCVCKTWKVLIEEDPYFIDLHLTRSKTRPSFFISYRTQVNKAIDWMAADGNRYRIPYQTWLMTTNLLEDGGRTDIQTIKNWDSMRFDTILGPLNGLICFVDKYKHHYAVCLYNVSTREVTPWILSNILLEERKYADIDMYHMATHDFGFDPKTKQHKVICILNLERKETNTDYDVCEVLTVGDNTWRRIDEVPPCFEILLESISVNGTLYWISRTPNTLENIQYNPEFLVAFDFGSEKFRKITVPNIVLDQFCIDGDSSLLEVDGSVALARIQSDYNTIKLWSFQDDKKNISNGTTSSKCWKEVTIALPFPYDKYRNICFHRGAGLGDNIIFQFYERDPNSVTHHYSYNLRKKTLTRIDDVGGTPSSYRDTAHLIVYRTFAESLLPVQKKQTRSTTSGKL